MSLLGSRATWFGGGDSNPAITSTIGNANVVYRMGRWDRRIQIGDVNGIGGTEHIWDIDCGTHAAGAFSIRDDTAGRTIFNADSAGARAEFLVPLKLPTYTVATRPSAVGIAGAMIYVSDGGAGAVIQASNGAAWVNLG